jgi:hypothetical protein
MKLCNSVIGQCTLAHGHTCLTTSSASSKLDGFRNSQPVVLVPNGNYWAMIKGYAVVLVASEACIVATPLGDYAQNDCMVPTIASALNTLSDLPASEHVAP